MGSAGVAIVHRTTQVHFTVERKQRIGDSADEIADAFEDLTLLDIQPPDLDGDAVVVSLRHPSCIGAIPWCMKDDT